MNSRLVNYQSANEALESALRNTAPITEPPGGLHDSIMQNVRAVGHTKQARPAGFDLVRHLFEMRWLPATGFAAFIVVAIWLAFQLRTQPSTQALPEISAVFTASQAAADALPSVTVGPLSEEMDKINQDLTHTTDFLLATLP